VLPDCGFDLSGERGMFLEINLSVLPPLSEALIVMREERPPLGDDLQLDAQVHDVAHLGDAFIIHDVEFSLAERGRDFVLGHPHPRARADDRRAVLERLDAAHVKAHARVKFERHPARRRLRVPEHHADLLPELISEDHGRVRLLDRAGELAQRLRHEAGLRSHRRVAHVAFDLGARDERRHRVDHDRIHRPGADEGLGDFEGLLAGIGLGDVQVVHVHSATRRIYRVERVLHVYERAHPALALGFSDDVLAEGGLARRLRPVDFGHAPARYAAHSQREVEGEGTGGDGIHRQMSGLAEAHQRAVAELLFDLREGRVEGFLFAAGGHA